MLFVSEKAQVEEMVLKTAVKEWTLARNSGGIHAIRNADLRCRSNWEHPEILLSRFEDFDWQSNDPQNGAKILRQPLLARLE